MTIEAEKVLAQLRRVKGPELSGNVVDLGLVSDLLIEGDKVTFSVTVPAPLAAQLEPLRAAAEKAARAAEGVARAIVTLTAAQEAREAPADTKPVRPAPTSDQAGDLPPPMLGRAPRQAGPAPKAPVPGIGAIVAVASGKGGVGKSTTSVNLALALAAQGLRIGILDADIYGPSMPRLLRISGRPDAGEGNIIEPLEAYGLKVMSMGFMVDEEEPMIWRGPMVMQALTQMLREVNWGTLDVLIVDMPPGTGDAQLTMAQSVPLAGAVIVSTPQDLALIDARKGLNMFRRVEVPILGLIENMSTFICPDCGSRHDIFGHGGARDEAARIGVPFLGEVPLEITIRSHSDDGTPIVIAAPDGPQAAIYRDIAARVWDRLGQEARMAGG